MNIWIYGHRCEYCSLASIHIPLPLFLASLVLGCCMWALSSCSEQGLLSKLWCAGFSVQWPLNQRLKEESQGNQKILRDE